MAFQAKYRGQCRNCGEQIEPGDLATYMHDHIVHDQCPDAVDPAQPGRQERKCPDCHTIHAGECF
ncbi:Uncharacterised protein [Mycobacteroides abscessus subsp. abscessus]|nr:Uncharacterised protein [Mycobacteroides abscessus subsp. abscessus]SID67996.1 Uncharacterised protein [Mycobacteroides abscessus subsp. abscessus]SKG39521.1 Uncharacterised protein [Mycobacteroides abscessus subsp. abscessus]SKQ79767.1 Uncharacterised protein [Mycobacteroides abscessus subsp. abscessus]